MAKTAPRPMRTPAFLMHDIHMKGGNCEHSDTTEIRENRYSCATCGAVLRKVRASVVQRRRLLKW